MTTAQLQSGVFTEKLDVPSVYVSTYAKYNDGNLKGAWVDLTNFIDYDDFLEYCRELHNDEQDPELMFQDFENFPKEYYSESGLNSDLWEYINLDDDDRELLEAYRDAGFDGDIQDAQNDFQGRYDSDEDFVMQLLEDCGDIPRDLPSYIHIDWESTARDIMFDYSQSNGFYFRNN